MTYHHLSLEERRIMIDLRKQGRSSAEIGRILKRDRSTIGREFRRNEHPNAGRWYYTYQKAHQKAVARRGRSRRNWQFSSWDWGLIEDRLDLEWSPEQISATLKQEALLSISHETIYQYVWEDKRSGGGLFHPPSARGEAERAADGW